jgi:hypothetical protein
MCDDYAYSDDYGRFMPHDEMWQIASEALTSRVRSENGE